MGALKGAGGGTQRGHRGAPTPASVPTPTRCSADPEGTTQRSPAPPPPRPPPHRSRRGPRRAGLEPAAARMRPLRELNGTATCGAARGAGRWAAPGRGGPVRGTGSSERRGVPWVGGVTAPQRPPGGGVGMEPKSPALWHRADAAPTHCAATRAHGDTAGKARSSTGGGWGGARAPALHAQLRAHTGGHALHTRAAHAAALCRALCAPQPRPGGPRAAPRTEHAETPHGALLRPPHLSDVSLPSSRPDPPPALPSPPRPRP